MGCTANRPIFPAKTKQVKNYLAYLFQIGMAPATLLTHISAIAFIHKIAGHSDPTDNFFIKRMLTGAQKLKGTSDNRKPFFPQHICSLISSLEQLPQPPYTKTMLKAMILLAFNAMLRVGEITSRSQKSADNKNNILLQNVKLSTNSITIQMQSYKHSKGDCIKIKLPKHKRTKLCPVKALKTYIGLRGKQQGTLFSFTNGEPVSCQFFNQQLNQLIKQAKLPKGKYSSHSLRIGGATTAIMNGASESQLKVMGRWKSDAFKKYIRAPIICNPAKQ